MMTDRQQEAYDYIVDTIATSGFSPTVREIGEHMDIKSTNGVRDHLLALERKGLIKTSPGRARAIALPARPCRTCREVHVPGRCRTEQVKPKLDKLAKLEQLMEGFEPEDAFDNAGNLLLMINEVLRG